MRQLTLVVLIMAVALTAIQPVRSQEPPAVNPFGPRDKARPDALPGYLELSDGSVHPGRIYLTRDARLKIFDEDQKRTRDVPLDAVKRIDAKVKREWMEREWRFKENANDEKVYTGRSYPSREYLHTITLHDGRTIRGPLSTIIYVQPDNPAESDPKKFLLHERDKGPPGTELKSLSYVRVIELGDKALEEGKRRVQPREDSKKERSRRKPQQ